MAAENYRAPSVAQSAELAEQQGVNGWDIAEKVRADLDRQSCPDAYMRIAVESVVKHLVATGKQQVGEVQGGALPPLSADEVAAMAPAGLTWDETGAWAMGYEACRKAALAARQPGAQEPVAVVGSDFTLLWAGSGPIAPIVERHGLKRGSLLYAAPPAQGIDLWQLRKLAMPILCGMLCASDAERACRRLHAAMIDQRDAAPGVGNG